MNTLSLYVSLFPNLDVLIATKLKKLKSRNEEVETSKPKSRNIETKKSKLRNVSSGPRYSGARCREIIQITYPSRNLQRVQDKPESTLVHKSNSLFLSCGVFKLRGMSFIEDFFLCVCTTWCIWNWIFACSLKGNERMIDAIDFRKWSMPPSLGVCTDILSYEFLMNTSTLSPFGFRLMPVPFGWSDFEYFSGVLKDESSSPPHLSTHWRNQIRWYRSDYLKCCGCRKFIIACKYCL